MNFISLNRCVIEGIEEILGEAIVARRMYGMEFGKYARDLAFY